MIHQWKKYYSPLNQLIFTEIHYRSEFWGHLFFDDCLNYYNLNYASEKIYPLN